MNADPLDELVRPESGCLTHRPPKDGEEWAGAAAPYLICDGCAATIRSWLTDGTTKDGQADNIPDLYAALDPTNRVETNGRRSPGFGSKPPASVHVMAMRDRRSNFLWHEDGLVYVWALEKLPEGVHGPLRGSYVDKTVAWLGADGKWYRDDAPSVSIAHVLGCLAWRVAEERTVTPPLPHPADLCEFLDRHLDWAARQPWITELHTDVRRLIGQLHTATGNPKPKPVAWCIQILDDGQDCDTPIYMPTPKRNQLDLPRLHCGGCGHDYTGAAIARLKISNELEGKRCS